MRKTATLDLSGVGNGNPLQDSCLKNSMVRGVWEDTVHGVARSWIRLSTHVNLNAVLKREVKKKNSILNA